MGASMAGRIEPIISHSPSLPLCHQHPRRHLRQHQLLIGSGVALAVLLLCVGIGAIAAIAAAGGIVAGGELDTVFSFRTIKILENAALQATFSTIGTGLVAIPAAVSLSHYRHWKVYWLAKLLCGVVLVIPTTVAALGLLEVWGRTGLIVSSLGWFFDGFLGIDLSQSMTIYGLHGVVLVHMLLNIPLMILIFLPLLESITPASLQVAKHLGMGAWSRFRLLEWPAMRPALLATLVLVFLLCFTSFAVVLMLGGGPKVTTLEVEIYAAIRFDYDFTTAAGLAFLQLICAAVVVSLIWIAPRQAIVRATDTTPVTPIIFNDGKCSDMLVLVAILVLVFLPLLMVVVAGVNLGLIASVSNRDFMPALVTSISVAVVSALVTTLAGFVLASARVRLSNQNKKSALLFLIDGGQMLYLVIPSMMLGTAAFILLRAKGDAFHYAFGVVVVANILLALPFCVRLLESRLKVCLHQHDRVAEMLGITGWNRLRLLTLPALEREIGLSLGLAGAISIGDLGVIALFASNDFRTLPWLLYQLAGRYQADEAKGLALILLLLVMVLLLAGRVLPLLILRIRKRGY